MACRQRRPQQPPVDACGVVHRLRRGLNAVGADAELREAPEDRRMQHERLVGQQQLPHRRQRRDRIDGAGAGLFGQGGADALQLPRELVAGVEGALPLPRQRLAVAFVRRQHTRGQRQHLCLLPAGLLILDGLQALRGPLAVLRRLDGLAGERIVRAGRDRAIQQDVGLDDEIVVGLRQRQRRLGREFGKDDVDPARQGRRIGGLSILLTQDGQALAGGCHQFASRLVQPSCLGELQPDCSLAERLDVLEFLGILRPLRRLGHEVAPAGLRRIVQDQANELLGHGEVEFVAVGKGTTRQDFRLGGREGVRAQQLTRRVGAAAQHLEPQQVVVGGCLQGELVRGPELLAVERRDREAHDIRGAGVILHVSEKVGAQPQEFESQEAVRWNCPEQRIGGGDQSQGALGIVVVQKLAGDLHQQARRVEAVRADQRESGDERLVEMVARCLEIGQAPRPLGSEQLQLGEQQGRADGGGNLRDGGGREEPGGALVVGRGHLIGQHRAADCARRSNDPCRACAATPACGASP